jgi:hypothetical protein
MALSLPFALWADAGSSTSSSTRKGAPYSKTFVRFPVTLYQGSADLPPIAAGWTTFAYLFKGSVSVGDSPAKYPSYHTLAFSGEPLETGVKITALEDGTELILVCFTLEFSPSVSHSSCMCSAPVNP